MLNRLELTKNVQLYKINRGVIDSVIGKILDEAASNKEPNSPYIINKFRESNNTASNIDYRISVRVFSTVRPVYFLDDDTFQDKIHAYIVLIELNGYLLALSKSCGSFSYIMKQHFDSIKPLELSKLLDSHSEVQKVSLRNMTVSDKAIRSRSYEASNLIGTFSTHAAGRSIPYHFRVRSGSIIRSISGTGRLVESSSRKKINEIVEWAHQQINLLQNSSSNEFFNLFASKVELEEVLAITSPIAILIDTSEFVDKLQDGTITLKWEKIRKKRINNNIQKIRLTRPISESHLNHIISALEKVYEVNTEWKIIGLEDTSKLKKNKNTMSISTKLLKKIRVEENGKLEGLVSYLNKKGLYSIVFEDPRYMYFKGNCFEDRSGISEIDNILELLCPQSNIENVTSEKGNFTNTQTSFDFDSMFGFVENIFSNEDYIFCDDLGDEWADHITFNLQDPSISFIHSKHGDTSTSASNLHDVVGQGIKNLGNMFFSKERLDNKIVKTLSNTYTSGKGIKTQIQRIRKTSQNFDADLINLLKNYKLHRKCILNCSFISKTDISTEFTKLKNRQPVRGHIIQLLWILSSFAHAAKEANVIPLIYCAA